MEDRRARIIEALVARRGELVGFAAARVENREVAEDLVQEALARSIERAGELRDDAAAVAWLYRILRNAVADHHRRRAAAARTAERLASEPEPGHGEAGHVCRCVSALAGELRPEYAEALRRVEIDGVAVKDLARELGITPGNAAVRVFRARESLRKKVMTTCKVCAEAGCTDCTCGAGAP